MTDKTIHFIVGAILGILAFGLGFMFYNNYSWEEVGTHKSGETFERNIETGEYRGWDITPTLEPIQ